jgi:hypothetical protein
MGYATLRPVNAFPGKWPIAAHRNPFAAARRETQILQSVFVDNSRSKAIYLTADVPIRLFPYEPARDESAEQGWMTGLTEIAAGRWKVFGDPPLAWMKVCSG